MSTLEAGCLIKMAARSGSIEVFSTVRDMLAKDGKVKRWFAIPLPMCTFILTAWIVDTLELWVYSSRQRDDSVQEWIGFGWRRNIHSFDGSRIPRVPS